MLGETPYLHWSCVIAYRKINASEKKSFAISQIMHFEPFFSYYIFYLQSFLSTPATSFPFLKRVSIPIGPTDEIRCREFKSNKNLFLNINQLDALNFIISLFQASTCFEHMCSYSGGQKLYYTVSGIITPICVMIPETV